jgi:hypothetical protein
MYKYDSELGFTAGLRFWLVSMIILVVLGVRTELSILYGAAGGAATWLIVSFWKSVKIPDDGTQPPAEPSPSVFKRAMTITERLRLPNEEVKMPKLFSRKPRRRI